MAYSFYQRIIAIQATNMNDAFLFPYYLSTRIHLEEAERALSVSGTHFYHKDKLQVLKRRMDQAIYFFT